jgi:peptide/nickel transport system substrate-binding protein
MARNLTVERGLRILLMCIAAASLVAAGIGAAGRGESRDVTRDTLVFGLSGDPDTLDPHATTGTLTFQTMRSVYDTLVEPDQDGAIIPALASAWDVSDDGLRWIFHLREGVTFHHGRTFTADDVVATIDRLSDPGFASPSAQEFAVIESVIAHDPTTVELVLAEPYAPLLSTLASGWSAILPADRIADGHDFGSHPIGTGPFRFISWVRDGEIVLNRFEDYWKTGLPHLEEVRFRIITEQAVMAQALVSGRIHVADIVVEPELSFLRATDSVRIYESTSALVMVLAINTRREHLNRLEVRKAINAAIDKQAVLDTAYAGGQVIGTFMDVGNPYYVDFTDMHQYDPEFSRSVTSRIDFERDLVIALPQNFEPHVRAGELYHEMLRQAGFPVRTQLVDWSTWLGDVYRGGQFDLTVIGHTGKLDPHGRLAPFGRGESYVGWVDPPTAEAVDAARREQDPRIRKELYTFALRRMAEDLPFVFVGSPFRYVGLNAAITGFHMDSQLDTADLRNVRFQQ